MKNRLDPENYHYLKTREKIFHRYKASNNYVTGSLPPVQNKNYKTQDPKVTHSGKMFLENIIFGPSAEDRKQFDSEIMREKFKGPITNWKRIKPNLIPLPIFILGAYSMRSAAFRF